MAIEMAALEMDRQPSESIKFALDSNCTDVTDCSRTIPNSVCVASVCKCAVGFGPSNDRKECRKSKRIGQPCHPTQNTCYLQKLNCDELSGVCDSFRFDPFDRGTNRALRRSASARQDIILIRSRTTAFGCTSVGMGSSSTNEPRPA